MKKFLPLLIVPFLFLVPGFARATSFTEGNMTIDSGGVNIGLCDSVNYTALGISDCNESFKLGYNILSGQFPSYGFSESSASTNFMRGIGLTWPDQNLSGFSTNYYDTFNSFFVPLGSINVNFDTFPPTYDVDGHWWLEIINEDNDKGIYFCGTNNGDNTGGFATSSCSTGSPNSHLIYSPSMTEGNTYLFENVIDTLFVYQNDNATSTFIGAYPTNASSTVSFTVPNVAGQYWFYDGPSGSCSNFDTVDDCVEILQPTIDRMGASTVTAS